MVRLMRWMIGMILTSCSTLAVQNSSQIKNRQKKIEEGLYDLPPPGNEHITIRK